jgi:hypothetical protein
MATAPIQPFAATVEKRFRHLASVWRQDTTYLSSMTEADRHPAYPEIIDLGPAVVPFLMRELAANHTHWFEALHAITGANPLAATAGGNIPKMVEAWLRWAKDNDYRW